MSRRRSTEKGTQKAILLLCQRPHIRLFRVNSGSPVHGFKGAPRGTSDIIGWKRASQGGPLALFVALEVKDEEWTPPPKPKPGASNSTVSKYETYLAQQAFVNDVREAGGLATFVTSVEDAMEILGLALRHG